MGTRSIHEIRAGVLAILPAAVAVIPFALLLGARASEQGLSPLEVGLMSALVFAGSAQFIAIDAWSDPVPWVILALTTLLVGVGEELMFRGVGIEVFRGAGLSDGLGFGANTRIALINRGLVEMTRLGVALGANQETFMGLAGMGDLMATCISTQSRNRHVGEELGKVLEGAMHEAECWANSSEIAQNGVNS